MTSEASIKYSNENNNLCDVELKSLLEHYENQKQILEVCSVKKNRTTLEVQDLQFQLDNLQRTIEDVTRIQQQSYYNVQQDFDAMSSKYIKMKDYMNNLNKTNQELKSSIQFITAKELKIIDKIKQLEINKRKTEENINELQDKIQNELVIYIILLLLSI